MLNIGTKDAMLAVAIIIILGLTIFYHWSVAAFIKIMKKILTSFRNKSILSSILNQFGAVFYENDPMYTTE